MNPARILTVCMAAMILAGGAALAAESSRGKNVAAAIEKLTDARTKIVWVRSVVDGKGHVDADDGTFYQLMVFDTHEAKERVLLPGPASCAYPWITGDGEHVVYTLLGGAGKVCVVDWDGTNRKELSEGFALTLWRDPASGVQWVYVGNNYAQNDYRDRNHATAGITRYRLDDPSVKEPVWNKTHILEQRAALSGDGKRLGSGFPWPHQGVADLASGTWKKYGQGCNSSIAPDNSYRFFHMNGSHADITMYDDGGVNPRTIPVNYKPGGMFWSPKWTSHVRFLTVAGPFAAGFDYAPGSHIHIGRFDEAFAKVEAWAQVSDGPVRDTHGYAWILRSLGQFGGEAPYKVEVPAERLGGEWEITYGDGTAEKTTAIRHTYTKAGRFAMVARQGQRELKGTVDVLPRKAPRVTGALRQDDTHVLVTFDEPVKSEGAAVSSKRVVPGLDVAYYEIQENVSEDLGRAIHLDTKTPERTGTASLIDLAFAEAEAKEWFGLKFTGYVHVPKDGEYTFFTNSDDGTLLFIDNTEVVNNDGWHAPKEVSGRIRLEAGKHPIRLYFTQAKFGSELSVSYEGPGIAKSQIPSHALFRDEEWTAIDGAAVKLASGPAATRLYLDPLGRQLLVEFDQPLAAKETLVLEGITDCAQVPNAVANPRLTVQRPSWPADATGLVFQWKNKKAENRIWDPVLGGVRETGVNAAEPSGAARFNREGAAMAVGGAFAPDPGSPERLMEGIKKTHQFSFEIVLAAADLTQTKGNDDKPVSIFQWGNDWGEGLFWLLQEKNLLQVAVGGESGGSQKVFEMATLPDSKPRHVIVSIAPKRLAFYLDGKKVKEIDPSPASFIEVGPPPMRFAENAWRGTFEHVAMYNRFIEEPEAAKNAAAVAAELAQRKALPRIEVQAKLVAKSKVPDPGQMAPYRNALIVNEYSVEKVLKGKYAQKTIRVAQWGMLDLKPTPLAAQEPGASVKLVLENFADHEELVPELISDTLKEDFDLVLYTDVNL